MPDAGKSAGAFAFASCEDVTWVARTPAGHDSGVVVRTAL
jgi:hypothetical protein